MNPLLATTFLLLFSFQQPKPETVALVFGPEPERIEIIKTSEAELLFVELQAKEIKFGLNEEEKKTLAAVTYALGIIPDRDRLTVPRLNSRDRLDWEIRRGVRLPTQDAEPVKGRN
jgi:hypothetical protein